MPRRNRGLAAAACLLLAIFLFVLTLTAQIRLRGVEREISSLRSEQAELEREKGVVRVRLEKERSIENIERCAVEELGMSRCRGDQIVVIVIEDESAEYK